MISGNPFPRASITDSKAVPVGDTFIVVGGFDGGIRRYLDTIYKYEPLDDSWTLLETKLPFKKGNVMALMVEIDIFPPCSDGATAPSSSGTSSATETSSTAETSSTTEMTTTTEGESAAATIHYSLVLLIVCVSLYNTF